MHIVYTKKSLHVTVNMNASNSLGNEGIFALKLSALLLK